MFIPRRALPVICIALFASCQTAPAPIETPETDHTISIAQDQTAQIQTDAQDAATSATNLADTISMLTPDTATTEKLAAVTKQARDLADKNTALAESVSSLNNTIADLKASHEADNKKSAQSIAIAQKNETTQKAKTKFWRSTSFIVSGILVVVLAFGAFIIFVRK